jgi:hypothetical protein
MIAFMFSLFCVIVPVLLVFGCALAMKETSPKDSDPR